MVAPDVANRSINEGLGSPHSASILARPSGDSVAHVGDVVTDAVRL